MCIKKALTNEQENLMIYYVLIKKRKYHHYFDCMNGICMYAYTFLHKTSKV